MNLVIRGATEMNEIEKYFYTEDEEKPSHIEEFCWMMFVMIVEFVLGFMVGVSY